MIKFLSKIYYSKRNIKYPSVSPGFTILEIIISLFIMIIIFSVAQANYRGFITDKNLDAARDRIVSDIRLAQQHAQAGKKPSGCTSELGGYFFNTNSSGYEILADCGTLGVSVKTVQLDSFSEGLSLNNGQMYFRTLGKGPVFPTAYPDSLTLTLTQQTTGKTRTITVTVGGEIR